MPIASSRIGCAASNARTVPPSPRRWRTSSASPWIRRAVVLSLDETSQIQALERTRPSRPVTPGRPQTQPHGDVRHGTTTSSLMNEFDLESVEEAVHRGVVVAAASAAHGGYRLDIGGLLAKPEWDHISLEMSFGLVDERG
jgi:hypothetical protein